MHAMNPRQNEWHRLRVVWSVLLALALLSSAFAPSAPAQAQAPAAPRDADRRLQVDIKSIAILADHDYEGQDEYSFHIFFRRVLPGCAPDDLTDECDTGGIFNHIIQAKGNGGSILQIGQTIPNADTDLTEHDLYIHPLVGFPVFPDETYVFVIWGKETDAIFDDHLGSVRLHLTPENQWLRSEHTVRANKDTLTSNRDFEVKLEIRDVPHLPDLRPVNLKVIDAPGGAQKLVCAAIVNSGGVDAGPFAVAFMIDGVTPPGGRTSAGKLPAGQHGELCVQVAVPAGQHQLTAFVDEPRGIDEVSDTNNRIDLAYTAAQAGAAEGTPGQTTVPSGPGAGPASSPVPSPMPMPSPAPGSGAGKADLTVSTIKVNGRAPDGKDDCKDGKNTVTVVVKNAGAANVESVAVRLLVDGAETDAPEQTVKELGAGKEREVRFGDVKLDKGEHTLAVQLGASRGAAEANNQPAVTVACKAGN